MPHLLFLAGFLCRLASVQEDEVRDYWSYCGEIEDLDLMRFPDTGRFKGIAFVTFADVSISASLQVAQTLTEA